MENVQENLEPLNVDDSNIVALNVPNVETNSTPTQIKNTTPCESQAETQVTQHTQKRKLTSDVWLYFQRKWSVEDGKMKAICNRCGTKLSGDPGQGTSHPRNHWKTCALRNTRDIRQAIIKTEQVDNQTVMVGSYSFNQDIARRSAVRMIILHEYPLAMVDHIGFKDFCVVMQPLFNVVSRNTIKADIMKLYKEEKENTMKFIYVSTPHNRKTLADTLLEYLMDWNLDRKLSTLTLDNCSTNDAMIERILNKISPRSLILGGQLFHMCCCAHILNLIVKEGMSLISGAIDNIRDSVGYWTATPKREEKFIETCGQAARDTQYKTLPSEIEWMKAKEICERLEVFYDVTNLFSGTEYPTANVYFSKVCEMNLALVEWFGSTDKVIKQMASSMLYKFDKYWKDVNGVMAVGTLLLEKKKPGDTLEALMFVQDWLWTDVKGSTKSKVENIEINSVLEDTDADIFEEKL
ncbi:zinc finger BED domain-containing protein RICESLEEPER 2-like [Vicia villosa]|uniref:zinc finger BED domain-containing protein RICESLEEPER 2-like n=1 Tax=Vicia villosa TaxID=3911 RepID=UPI00273CE320|nr:zinc finger BED domain-containing protein RICESLEEPER 2-like [Vicia villosa]